MTKKAKQFIDNIFKYFIKGSDIVQVICLCGIILNYGIMIALRSFGVNYRAMEETVLLLAIWSYAVGAYEGTYNEEHIAAGLIQGLFKSERAKNIHKFILDFISFIICVIITIWTWNWVMWSIPLKARSTVYGYPLYFKYFAMLFMYGISIIFFLRSCLNDINKISVSKTNKKDEEGLK